jgi:hypothetical protein
VALFFARHRGRVPTRQQRGGMSDTTATTTPLAVWAGMGAAALGTKAYFEAPWWVWVAVLSWLVLTVVAILGQSEAESRKFLSGTLRKSTYTQIYTGLVGRSHDRLWNANCDPVERGAALPAMFRAALTWRLYDRALLLAVIYPILLPVLWWLVTGGAAQLGPVVFLEATGFREVWPERVAVLGALLIWNVRQKAEHHRLTNNARNRTQTFSFPNNWLAFILPIASSFVIIALISLALISMADAGAGLLVGLVAVGLASLGFGVGAITLALSLGIPGATAVIGAVVAGGFAAEELRAGQITIAIGVAVACLVGAIVAFLDNRGRPRLARLIVSVTAVILWLQVAQFWPWDPIDATSRTMFLFLGVLPLINALFDVISYAVTLSFIQRGRESRLPWLYGLADLGVALVLFLALGVAMVAVIAGLNGLAGTDILDLGGLLRDVRDQPGSYWWLYGIAFSTILPTALHAGLALLGVQGLWPKGVRRVVAGWIGNAADSQIDATRGAFALGLLWAVPVWVIVAFGWATWHWAGTLATALAGKYLTVLERVAATLGAG